ncbi:MAG: family 16 glycosylhydrolase [Candidatus Marinimicrobia bacterium]|nr:family 16 glycosylhydrolase [Candidatus Neomarinimicrobiota bacterium]
MTHFYSISTRGLGILILIWIQTLSLMAKDYRGAELRTIETFQYGRFEARIKSAPHSGTVSSLFTYHELGGAGIQDWSEIDIEFLGRYTDRVQFNTITDWQINHEHFVTLDYDPATEFHDYAFEWTPSYVAWFVDGIEVYRQVMGHIVELNRYQKLMMNIWLPNYPGWVGTFNPSDLPIYAYYDWVSYCEYTPLSGNTGSSNNFTQLWRDDFDGWDTNRWQKASHTWDGNNCDFTPANVVFNGGFMILCLTTPSNTGYDGPALAVDGGQGRIPSDLRLNPAWPNPFNATTNLVVEGFSEGELTLQIHSLTGSLIRSEIIAANPVGSHTLQWNGQDNLGELVSSGSYIIQVISGKDQICQKVVLLK